MKKGLSVLLIAAALFGFYGGAVNLNDVLACKDYWEEAGEKSTADMNKLEDGLNQLKDNEQAYLDGLEAVVDGEEALAQGEKDYAAGKAELAKGEADYAAAPGKLAKGEKDLAAGKKKLADGYAAYNAGKKDLATGKEQLKGLAALIKGMNDIINAYNNEWKPGYETLRDGRRKIAAGVAGKQADLIKLAAFLDGADAPSYVDAVKAIAGDDDKQDADSFTKFISNAAVLAKDLPTIQTAVENTLNNAKGIKAHYIDTASKPSALQAAVKNETVGGGLNKLAELIPDAGLKAQFQGAINAAKNGVANDEANVFVVGQDEEGNPITQPFATIQGGISGALGNIISTLEDTKDSVNSTDMQTLIGGAGLLAQNAGAPAQLKAGQDTMAGGVQQIAGGVLSSDTLKNAVKEKMGTNAITLLNVYKNNPNPLNSSISDFAVFATQMDTNPGFTTILGKAKALMAAAAADGQATVDDGEKKLKAAEKQLAQGEKDLAAGKKKLAQGYADYKAAPGKLADGRAQLAEGLQKLMDGRQELADGKEKLAEYEDGEQQVRDGLATLMGTAPDGGLVSILDRRNGDDDFDNGDTHLDLDEGLDAVTVGRGYQADSGELITKEITNRAIGTAAGLGAGALAVLAAILSFLKKNKGAGISAILSAAAGGAGVAAGTSAGMEFSHIAGSAVGATPWIAFGVLAGVALVHAIAHFASKEA